MIPIIGFAPDADPAVPGVITECENFIPTEGGFKGAPAPVQLDIAALSATCVGASSVTNLSSTVRFIAGTSTKLYELSGSTWTDRSGSTYALGSDDRWSFVQFGNSTLAATPNEPIQRSTSAAFSDIAGAPQAKIIEAAQGFALAFNTSSFADEWYCCAYLDDTDWTLSAGNQCVKGRLIGSPGPINAAKRFGDDVIAYKATSMFVGTYVGAPEVWRWRQVSTDVGCVGIEAVVATPVGHIFVGNDNVYLFDGTTPKPLATGVIRKWLYDDMSSLHKYKTICLWDRGANLVWIYYPSSSSSGAIDRCAVYHILTQRWGLAHSTIESAAAYSSGAFTYDTGPSFTYDAGLQIPYDSGFWISGRSTPAVFDSVHKLSTLSGVCASSYFTTGDVGDDEGYAACMNLRIRYSQRPTTSTATGYYKDESGTVLTSGSSQAMADGRHNLRQSARWHRFKVETAGDYQCVGFRPEFVPAGRR